jgi:hypothetical protein
LFREAVDAKTDYKIFGALNPFFKVVLKGLKGLVDGEHYFDTFAEDAIFESRYHFPGWPSTIRGRANLMASLSGYGNTIRLQSGFTQQFARRMNKRIETITSSSHLRICQAFFFMTARVRCI